VSRAEPESLITIYNIVEWKFHCFVYLCHHTLHWLWLLTWGLCIGLCYFSSIFVPYLAFRIHFAGDLNQKLSLVARVLSTSFARALLGLIRLSPSCSLQLGIQVFFNIIHIRLTVFFKQQICIERWFSTILYRESVIHYSNPL